MYPLVLPSIRYLCLTDPTCTLLFSSLGMVGVGCCELNFQSILKFKEILNLTTLV
jgi:hypothetical protein